MCERGGPRNPIGECLKMLSVGPNAGAGANRGNVTWTVVRLTLRSGKASSQSFLGTIFVFENMLRGCVWREVLCYQQDGA